jgi:hypothetical protein
LGGSFLRKFGLQQIDKQQLKPFILVKAHVTDGAKLCKDSRRLLAISKESPTINKKKVEIKVEVETVRSEE